MQQRQLRLGDILDDYCPRERRLTNHAVVAMVGPDVRLTRCATCDTEHEYKHARVPRQRRKSETPAALAVPGHGAGPKRVAHEAAPSGIEPPNAVAARNSDERDDDRRAGTPSGPSQAADPQLALNEADQAAGDAAAADPDEDQPEVEEGPVHRPLIRATLPRQEGQPPTTRPAPDFTIRQPGGRPTRFRPRHQRGGPQFPGNRTNGNLGGGPMRSGAPRQGGRPPMTSRLAKRHGPARKRSK